MNTSDIIYKTPEKVWTRLCRHCPKFVSDNRSVPLSQCQFFFLHKRFEMTKSPHYHTKHYRYGNLSLMVLSCCCWLNKYTFDMYPQFVQWTWLNYNLLYRKNRFHSHKSHISWYNNRFHHFGLSIHIMCFSQLLPHSECITPRTQIHC